MFGLCKAPPNSQVQIERVTTFYDETAPRRNTPPRLPLDNTDSDVKTNLDHMQLSLYTTIYPVYICAEWTTPATIWSFIPS